jgi:hypothetical protein
VVTSVKARNALTACVLGLHNPQPRPVPVVRQGIAQCTGCYSPSDMLPRLRCRAAASCLRLQPHRVLRGRRQQHSSSSSSSSVSPAVQRRKGSTAAIAFDIDGVLLRGKELIPQATEALHLISSKETGGSASALTVAATTSRSAVVAEAHNSVCCLCSLPQCFSSALYLPHEWRRSERS